MASRIATPDQIVDRNVERLRKTRRLTVTQLAKAMRVSRATIYDYEPETGRGHAFKWAELIALCAALECSIFDLVLPDEGEKLDLPEWVTHGDMQALDADMELSIDNPEALHDVDPADVEIAAGQLGVVATMPPGREELVQVVFHAPADLIDQLQRVTAAGFEEWRDRFREAELLVAREARQKMIETLRSALADLETEGETE